MKEAKILVKDLGLEGFEGEVVVEVLKFRQRLNYSKQLNFKTDEKGEIVVDNDMFDTTEKMIDLTEKHIKKVDIKHLESGAVAKSFEDLEYDPVFDEAISIICGAVLNAGKVGKR